jgi:hypothetical protein
MENQFWRKINSKREKKSIPRMLQKIEWNIYFESNNKNVRTKTNEKKYTFMHFVSIIFLWINK